MAVRQEFVLLIRLVLLQPNRTSNGPALVGVSGVFCNDGVTLMSSKKHTED